MPGKKLFLINSRFPLADKATATLSLPLEQEQTVSLLKASLLDTVHRFRNMDNAGLRVITASEEERTFLAALLPDEEVLCYAGDTPGDILAEAAAEAFEQGARQIFILDSAVPTVPVRIVKSGLSLLEVFDDAFTIAPIERGGFFAVGMNSYHGDVLRGIDPATTDGYEQVIGRICEFDASVYILNSWYDIRQFEDIVQLRGEIMSGFSGETDSAQTKAVLEELQIDLLIEQNDNSDSS
jgi:glycosyltransferase A (GT-A) superfamily protein (DUF2064 family)